VAAASARSDAEHASTYATYQSHWSTAGARLDVAIGALAIGAALTATGVGRFLLVRRQARNQVVAIWLGPGMLGGAF
jgi:hypothetical protein